VAAPPSGGIWVAEAGVVVMRKTRKPQKTSVVSGEDKDCTVVVNLVMGSERRSPSHAIEVGAVNSSAEGTDSWRLDHQVVEVPGLGSGTGIDSVPESCKSPARIATVPTAVECTLL